MHPQDRLLIAEALVAFAGDARIAQNRELRAWELAERLLADTGIPQEALVSQVDRNWSGPEF